MIHQSFLKDLIQQNLKTEADKLDVAELQTTSVDLNSDVLKSLFVKKSELMN